MFHLSRFGQQGDKLVVYVSDEPFNKDGTPRQGQLAYSAVFSGQDLEGLPWEHIVRNTAFLLESAAMSVQDVREDRKKAGDEADLSKA